MSEITIRTKDKHGDHCSEVIEAEVIGPFAIHESRNHEDCWTLTHLGTGYTVVSDAPNALSCRIGAKHLMALKIDWSFTDPGAVKSWDADVTEAMHGVRKAIACGEFA